MPGGAWNQRSPGMTPRRHCGRGTAGRVRRAFARLLLSSLLVLLAVLGLAPGAMAAPVDVRAGIADRPDGHDVPELRDVQGLRARLQAAAERRSGAAGRSAIRSRRTCSTASISRRRTIDRYTSAPIGSPYSYRGGPFIIDSANVAAARPDHQCVARRQFEPADHPRGHRAVHRRTSTSFCAARPGSRSRRSTPASRIAYFNAAGIPDSNGQRLVVGLAEHPQCRPDRLQQHLGVDLPRRRRRQRAVPARRVPQPQVRRVRHAAQRRLFLFEGRPDQRRHAGLRRARQFRQPGRRLDRAVPLDPEQREHHRRPLQLHRARCARCFRRRYPAAS